MCWVGTISIWFFDKVAPGLLSASLGAFILARILEHHRANRDFLSKEVADICASLKEFWGVCRDYWLPATLKNQAELEEKITYLQMEIAGAVKVLGDNFDEAFRTTSTELVMELINESTGGRFKDPQRQSDMERVARIRSVCLRLKQHLHTSRRAKLRKSGK